MLPKSELAPWLKSVMLLGYEDPAADPNAEGDPGEEGDEGKEEGEKQEDPAEDLAKLKRALAAERLKNKNLERKLKGPKADEGEGEEDPEGGEEEPEKGKAKGARSASARAAEAKLQKVTAAFVRSSFANTVRSLATNFLDPDDAIAAIDMKLIQHEQDDDDPSNIVWDESEIKTALKDLAKRKPHFLKPAEAGGEKTPKRPSGSKFSGPAGRPGTTPTEPEKLKDWQQRLPAMRNIRAK